MRGNRGVSRGGLGADLVEAHTRVSAWHAGVKQVVRGTAHRLLSHSTQGVRAYHNGEEVGGNRGVSRGGLGADLVCRVPENRLEDSGGVRP